MMVLGEGMIDIPTACHVIEHPRHGVLLFDTGLNPAISDPEAADRHFGKGVREGFGAGAITRQHAIDEQLRRLGYRTDDVNYVIYSHLHLDHAGGMMFFPNAKHVVQRDEIRYAWWPDKWTRSVYCHNDFAGARHFDFLEIDGDVDLFADGLVKLIKTPGHAPGHQIMLLDLAHRGRICLAADAAHTREAFMHASPMPWDHDIGATMLSYTKVRMLEESGTPAYFAHDMNDYRKLPIEGAYWD